MMDALPKVSIGLPVYNGERFVSGAIESLLKQSHAKIELLISDNCSTDGTANLCRAAALRDSRVSFNQNPRNIGAASNFCHVFESATGKYFMWAAHDDSWEPDFVSKCVAALEANPSVVLCASDVRFIDQLGRSVSERSMRVVGGRYNRLQTVELDLRRRVSELTRELNWYAVYGVIRTEALRKTRLFTGAYGSDVILLMELLLQGETLILPEPLFHYRIQKKSAADQLRDITGAVVTERKMTPYTDLARSLLGVIENASLTDSVKAELTDDLLTNVSRRNRRWQKLIVKENPETYHRSSFERARNIRKLLAPRFVELNPSGRFQVALEERWARVNEIGVKVRRNLGRLAGR